MVQTRPCWRVRSLLLSFLLALGAVVAVSSAASAQAPKAPLPKQDTPPPAAQQQQRCAPQNQGANPTTPETRGQAVPGEQLSKSDGVICPPPGIDPEMSAPPPGGGKTPVIPPPGTPGGNPNVVPK